MPQTHRKVAFSNKKKREQFKLKRSKKQLASDCISSQISSQFSHFVMDEIEEIGGSSATAKYSRYNLKFKKAKREKMPATKPIISVSNDEMEVDSSKFFPLGLTYPKRPPWNREMSKATLHQLENKTFNHFCEQIDKTFTTEELSMYEMNLETWRQLWRVTEMSDILLIIVDIRYAVAQFPPYLYHHLVDEDNKRVILILNKCDLVSSSVVLAWQDYFSSKFPKLIALPFSSMEGVERGKKRKMATYGSLSLIDACSQLVDGHVDLSVWRRKVEEEAMGDHFTSCEILEHDEIENTWPEQYKRFARNVLTLGTIGHPNVGKSSLINALMGKKVVRVSKAPGRTKYFQTIFITKNIKLCDCPGLVFPSLCDKRLQVLIASYPIAQVRDTVAVIDYIASRLDLPSLLKLNSEDQEEGSSENFEWTAFSICEAWAKKRGFFAGTKGARPDVHRAGNELLRFSLVGLKSLNLVLKPPNFSIESEKYETDSRLPEIERVQSFAHQPCESDIIACEKNSEDNAEETAGSSSPMSNQIDSNSSESDSDESEGLDQQLNPFAVLDVEC